MLLERLKGVWLTFSPFFFPFFFFFFFPFLSSSLIAQLERTPREFPTLKFNRQVPDIDSFKYEDFLVENYNPMGKIEMKMSV